MSSFYSILLVHIGPVQDFIASARRCRDLWFGSQLLSNVSRVAAEAMIEQASVKQDEALIFPGEINRDSSVANKIQLVLNTRDDTKLREIAEAGRTAVGQYLRAQAKAVFDEIQPEREEDFDRTRAEEQIESMMEFMWVALKSEQDLKSDDAAYRSLRQKAEAMLAARKNTRGWSQYAVDDAGIPKSSLDGVRPSVMGRNTRSNNYTSYQLYGHFKARPGEQLCGVGLFKRLGAFEGQNVKKQRNDEPVFHSTSHIAALPLFCRPTSLTDFDQVQVNFVRDIEVPLLHENPNGFLIRVEEELTSEYTCCDPRCENSFQGRRVLEHYDARKTGANLGLDGVLLFPSRIEANGPSSVLSMVSEDDNKKEDIKKQILNAQHTFFKDFNKCKGTNIQEPLAYYALLLADGDKMGVAIDALGSLEKHKNLSKILDQEFAQKCKKTVSDLGGTLIYAGGDDVLAMLPMHTALQCAEALKDLFSDAMNNIFEGTKIKSPTLSVGLAIAHHLEPLGEVRELAKRAEKLAKVSGRNSLAIALAKRSQEPLLIVDSWDHNLAKRIYKWARLLEFEDIPNRLPYRLLDMIAPLEADLGGTHDDTEALQKLCAKLVKQVLDRRALKNETLVTELEGLYQTAVKILGKQDEAFALIKGKKMPNAIAAVHYMSSELRIAEEFNRAYTMAFGHLETSSDTGETP